MNGDSTNRRKKLGREGGSVSAGSQPLTTAAFVGRVSAFARRMTFARRVIARAFWKTEGHVTAEELHRLVQREKPNVGLATVYRTLRLLCEAGLAEEHKFPGGVSYYEHRIGHAHHDHLICVQCGEVREFQSKSIERMQEEVCRQFSFLATGHSLQLFGVCASCAAAEQSTMAQEAGSMGKGKGKSKRTRPRSR